MEACRLMLASAERDSLFGKRRRGCVIGDIREHGEEDEETCFFHDAAAVHKPEVIGTNLGLFVSFDLAYMDAVTGQFYIFVQRDHLAVSNQ